MVVLNFTLVKSGMFSLLMLCIAPAFCQVENRLTVTGSGAFSASFSPAYEGGLMLGIRSGELSDFRVGAFYRQLAIPVSHSGSYFSLALMGSRQLWGRFGVHVQGELRHGSYFLTEEPGVPVTKAVRLFGNMGVNFQATEQIQVLTSYVFEDYDPRGYVLKQRNPGDAGAWKLGINYTIPLGPSFLSRSYDRR